MQFALLSPRKINKSKGKTVSNIVTKVLNNAAGLKKLTEIDGNLIWGTPYCEIKGTMGGVYGIAVEIQDNGDKQKLFEEATKIGAVAKRCKSINDWQPLDKNGKWYPLYWGADLTLGARIRSHARKLTKTNSVYLSKKPFLQGHNIVYGAILCSDYLNVENALHNDYKDLFKTTNKKQIEKLNGTLNIIPPEN